MTVLILIIAALAGLLHVFIFTLESFRWEEAGTRRSFGTTAEQAAMTRQLAYNQGFYNLFLAITAFAGIALAFWPPVSTALLVVSLGSMLAAAVVLVSSDRTKLRAAAIQGTLPLIGLVLLAVRALQG
ncbi:MAG TPA: DUF1304 domain-containing protein [Micropruina sp.]|nr:DUF1304 domain-containing protein [Micropruina sp.]